MKLVYTGPVKECGFAGPVTGNRYVVRPNRPFSVDDSDGAALLRKYPTVLNDVKPTSRRKSKGASEETDHGEIAASDPSSA